MLQLALLKLYRPKRPILELLAAWHDAGYFRSGRRQTGNKPRPLGATRAATEYANFRRDLSRAMRRLIPQCTPPPVSDAVLRLEREAQRQEAGEPADGSAAPTPPGRSEEAGPRVMSPPRDQDFGSRGSASISKPNVPRNVPTKSHKQAKRPH